MCGGLLPLALGALVIAVGWNLYTYAALTREAPVAELGFRQTGPQTFEARVVLADGRQLAPTLRGDDWRIEAQVLKFHGWASMLGAEPRYRLDRLSGRYRAAEQERSAPRSVVELIPRRGVDVWQWAEQYPGWLPFVDASYGSGAYLPMHDGARYRVSLGQSGLIARRIDASAKEKG